MSCYYTQRIYTRVCLRGVVLGILRLQHIRRTPVGSVLCTTSYIQLRLGSYLITQYTRIFTYPQMTSLQTTTKHYTPSATRLRLIGGVQILKFKRNLQATTQRWPSCCFFFCKQSASQSRPSYSPSPAMPMWGQPYEKANQHLWDKLQVEAKSFIIYF